MRKLSTFVVLAVLAALLAGCMSWSGSGRRGVRTREVRTPSPVRVRFFNASSKTVTAHQAGGIQFTLSDGVNTDTWGDASMGNGDVALKTTAVTLNPFGSTSPYSVGADLNSPQPQGSTNPDTTVNASYRTIGGVVTVDVTGSQGTVQRPVPFSLPASHATGDISGKDKEMFVFAANGTQANEVIVTVWVRYRHNSIWYDLAEHQSVIAP